MKKLWEDIPDMLLAEVTAERRLHGQNTLEGLYISNQVWESFRIRKL